MVYVDSMKPCVPNERWPWRTSCHLFADSDDELHRFAAKIGLQRSWFQKHKRLNHYDLTWGKRKMALQDGAIAVTDKQMVGMFSKPEGVQLPLL